MSARAEDPLARLDGLIGDWVAVAQPGQPKGSFSLVKELGGQALLRRNHAELPATSGRGASIHDDLMLISSGSQGLTARYVDSEGHLIDYRVEAAADGQRITFVSISPGPVFRLRYEKDAAEWVIVFEMAAPNAPDAFRTVQSGRVRRRP